MPYGQSDPKSSSAEELDGTSERLGIQPKPAWEDLPSQHARDQPRSRARVERLTVNFGVSSQRGECADGVLVPSGLEATWRTTNWMGSTRSQSLSSVPLSAAVSF